jgi:hypothetical protein
MALLSRIFLFVASISAKNRGSGAWFICPATSLRNLARNGAGFAPLSRIAKRIKPSRTAWVVVGIFDLFRFMDWFVCGGGRSFKC